MSDSKSGANHPMFGKTHTEDTRAQMSKSQQLVDRSGANHPMYGRTGALNPMFGRTGANHPMFGITPTNAMTINVYTKDNVLVHSFPSQVAVAKWLGIKQYTVSRFIKTGKVWNNQYTFRNSSL
jgi:group I intron endonuclease